MDNSNPLEIPDDCRKEATPESPVDSSSQRRRGFAFQLLALLLGLAAYAVPTMAAVCSFLNPLRQKSPSGQFMKLTSLESLGETPRKFSVIADRTDAWNRFANEPVGAVFLRRTEGDQVEAIQVVCPHAGCSIQFDGKEKQFLCPCHMATFDISGRRSDEATNNSPRDLDRLEVEIRNGSEVWIKFENFRTGTTDQVVEA